MMTSGSGSVSGWRVEARCEDTTPRVCNGTLLGHEWTVVDFHKSPLGVPVGEAFHQPWLSLAGLYSFESAQALRWWWSSELGFGGRLMVQTRLVRCEIKYEYNVERMGSGHMESGETTRYVNNLKDDEEPTDD